MKRFLRRLWRKRQRTIDRTVLFPTFLAQAPTPEEAHKAITWHVRADPAWRYPEEYRHEDTLTGAFICCGPHCDH